MLSIKILRTSTWIAKCFVSLLLARAFAGMGWAANATHIQGSANQPGGAEVSGSLIISWPAFTTASNEDIPAGRLTTAIDPDGRLSVDLVPNAGSVPSHTYYTADYQLNDGSFRREYWLVPAVSQVSLAEVRKGVGTTDPPQVSQSLAAPADAWQKPNALPEHTEIERYGTQGDKPRSPGPSQTHLVDTVNGHQGDFFHDPDRNPFSNQYDSWLQVCNYTSQPGWTGGGTGWAAQKIIA